MVRQAREKIPEGVKKNEIVADYNEADHALKFPERRGCRARIETGIVMSGWRPLIKGYFAVAR
jgi:hypothetical protein